MKDRLTELIKKMPWRIEQEGLSGPRISNADKLADYLLGNGVIAPPVRLGQTCFEPCYYLNKADECRVSSIMQKADGTLKIRFTNLRSKWVFEMVEEDIGKHIFLTIEEAEQALKERSEK
ncbi:MAG: hypothetical protein J6S71_00610 [Clostridia bacterium]|nr:hypothetical protein [Clostridia bacterium]